MNDFVEPIFNMNKIKFDKLDELSVIRTGTKHVNLFISLECVLKTLINGRTENQLRASGYDGKQLELDLISGIINLGQHYRLYCAKNRVSSKIILYWNYPMASYRNRTYIPKYRDEYNRKMFRSDTCPFLVETLQNAHELLKTTVDYVNEVYLVDGGVTESSLVPYVLMKEKLPHDEQTQNIIVSRFGYDFQYIGSGDTVVRPARDNSDIITMENLVDHLKTTGYLKNPLMVPLPQIPTLLAMIGDEHREIPKLDGYGLSGAVKSINNAIQSLKIHSGCTEVEYLAEVVEPQKYRQFQNNYRSISFEYQYSELTPVNISYIENQLVDKFDDDKLNEINETIFRQCPLMIVNTRSEQVRNTECFRYDAKSIFL